MGIGKLFYGEMCVTRPCLQTLYMQLPSEINACFDGQTSPMKQELT